MLARQIILIGRAGAAWCVKKHSIYLKDSKTVEKVTGSGLVHQRKRIRGLPSYE
jgi:hypothetical protein